MKKIIALTAIAAFAATAAMAEDKTATPAPATTMTAPAPAAGLMAKELKDGTKVWVNGSEVFVESKDGKKSPAPDGTWELKDGTKITTKGGKEVK